MLRIKNLLFLHTYSSLNGPNEWELSERAFLSIPGEDTVCVHIKCALLQTKKTTRELPNMLRFKTYYSLHGPFKSTSGWNIRITQWLCNGSSQIKILDSYWHKFLIYIVSTIHQKVPKLRLWIQIDTEIRFKIHIGNT